MVQDQYIRHVGIPDTKLERERKPSMKLDDFEALYLRRALRRYAHYNEIHGDANPGIARAYVELIDQQVRENKQDIVDIFFHTPEAYSVLINALEDVELQPSEVAEQIAILLADKFEEVEA